MLTGQLVGLEPLTLAAGSSKVCHGPRGWLQAHPILFFALASLSSANDVTVRQLASGIAAGDLLDAVVVRKLLLPALVSLFGKANT